MLHVLKANNKNLQTVGIVLISALFLTAAFLFLYATTNTSYAHDPWQCYPAEGISCVCEGGTNIVCFEDILTCTPSSTVHHEHPNSPNCMLSGVTLSNLNQFASDGITPIEEGDTTAEDQIIFKSTVESPQNLDVKLQVELRQFNEPFTGTFDGGIIESSFVSSGQEATITRLGLTDGQYHWRARAIDTNGNTSDWQEFGTEGNVDFEVKRTVPIDIAVILAEPSDVPHESNEITAQPCKLIPEDTYPNGHNIDYFQDLAFCVEDYHRENSFGILDLNFEFFDNNGAWFETSGKEKDYVNKEPVFVIEAVRLAEKSGVDFSGKDIVLVVSSGDVGAQTWPPKSQPLNFPPYKAIVAEEDLLGVWAHEIGHILGEFAIPNTGDRTMLPDLYKMGLDGGLLGLNLTSEGDWGLMALNALNHGDNPAYMTSFTEEFLGWLDYDIHPSTDFGNHVIQSLNTAELGDSVFRYNLEDNTSENAEEYYILEARNRTLNTWDKSLPLEKGLVLYKIDSFGFDKYGYKQSGGANVEDWTINIPLFGGTLSSAGDSYLDLDNLIKFTVNSDGFVDGNYIINTQISDISPGAFVNKFNGIIVKSNSQLLQKVKNLSPAVLNYLPSRGPFSYGKLFTLDCCVVTYGPGLYILLSLALIGFIFWLLRKKVGFIGETTSFIKDFASPSAFKLVLLVAILIFNNKIGFFHPFSWFEVQEGYFSGSFAYSRPVRLFAVNIFADILIWYIVACFATTIFKYRNKLKYLAKVLISITIFSLIVGVVALGLRYLDNFIKPSLLITNYYSNSSSVNAPFINGNHLPDLDLHAFTPDGAHVGMNYETGEYEVDIAGALTAGDMSNDSEWIFIPEDIEASFTVSACDNLRFIEENPEAVEQIEDLSDSYDIYARFVDPDDGIFTSETLEDNTINPGENYIHTISGDTDISLSEGALQTQITVVPQTINLNQEGTITAILNVSCGFMVDIESIDLSSIILNGASPTHSNIIKGRNELRLTFNTQDLNLQAGGDVVLKLKGTMEDGTNIEATDTVKVIDKGKPSSFFSFSNFWSRVSGILSGFLGI